MSTLVERETPERPPFNGDVLYEVVNGQFVELPPMSAQEVGLAGILLGHIWLFLGPNCPPWVVGEMLFHLADDLPERRPDVAYVSAERWPHRFIPRTRAWWVVPDLAVEVVSETNIAEEIQIKLHEYFRAGVRLVWVIYPEPACVYVYESPKAVKVLDRGDTLEGGQVLPGFTLPLDKLFEVLPPAQQGSPNKLP
jgi:Uma2 family endonuclease